MIGTPRFSTDILLYLGRVFALAPRRSPAGESEIDMGAKVSAVLTGASPKWAFRRTSSIRTKTRVFYHSNHTFLEMHMTAFLFGLSSGDCSR